MKFSVSNYSFSKMINAGQITAFECISKAKELGFDAIECVDFMDFNSVPEDERIEYAKKVKAEAERCGIEISCFTIGADFLNKGPDEINRVKKCVDIAEALGVKFMRHDATVGYGYDVNTYKGFDEVVNTLADACREIAEYAQTKGVKTMIENHGFFSQDSIRVEKLHNTINHPNFGLLCDMGNFLCADENPVEAFARVAPYAAYAHAKDFIVKPFDAPNPGTGSFRSRSGNFLRGTIIGHGNVPVKNCLHILNSAKYDGYIAIEFEGVEDVITGLTIGLENLKRYYQEVVSC